MYTQRLLLIDLMFFFNLNKNEINETYYFYKTELKNKYPLGNDFV